MKMMKILLMVVSLLATPLFLGGCDGESQPTKPGGGGQQQPYNPDNGQYEGK